MTSRARGAFAQGLDEESQRRGRRWEGHTASLENHIQEKNQEVSQVEESDTKLAQALIVIMARDEELAAMKRGQSMLCK